MGTSRLRDHSHRRRRRGSTLVEFSIAAVVFFMFMLMLIEVARIMYLWNTAQQVTQRASRAAAVTDFSSASAMAALRQQAIFRAGAGALMLGGSITDAYVRVDYLTVDLAGAMQPVAPLPANPRVNRGNCTVDPHAANCIRFVRARLCLPSSLDDCGAVPYEPLFNFFPGLGLVVPPSTALARAESLGYRPGLWP